MDKYYVRNADGLLCRSRREVRNAMGITVFTGMLGVTLFGLLLTPVFYVALRKLAGTSLAVEQPAAQPEEKSNA